MDKYKCYCCHKEMKDISIKEQTWISATVSGKCRDGTNAEKRLICNNCDNIKES